MKKYRFAYRLTALGAAICFFISALEFSKMFSLPLKTGDGLSSSVISGGIRDFETMMHAVAALIICALLLGVTVVCYKKAMIAEGGYRLFESKRKEFSVFHLFLIIAAAFAMVSIAFLSVHRETVWSHLLSGRGYDEYMDFFNHITYARYPAETYYETHHACFPALAYIFYYAISKILPMEATIKFNSEMTSPYAMLVYVFYVILLCCLLVYLVKKMLPQKGKAVTVFTVLLLLSNFFISTIERGNSVFIVLLLLMGAMILRDSEKPWQREVALILIAVAAGFKVYPAIFGLLYLVEKRYKEAVRLVLYGVVLFFLPFAFFGGVEGLMQFLKNQGVVQELEEISLQSVRASVRYASEKLTGVPNGFVTLEKWLPIAFGAVNLLGILSKKTQLWEKVFLLSAIMVFVPSWSGSYTPIYFAIPMILFFSQCQKNDKFTPSKPYSIVITVCFALAFSMIFLVRADGELMSNLSYLALYAIDAIVLVKALYLAITAIINKRLLGRD